MVGWSPHISLQCIVPPRNTFTPRWARIVEDSPDEFGMVTHVSHSVHTSQEHIYTKGRPGGQSRMVGMVSHVSFGACTIKEHIYTKIQILG
jgi:hypothetical protein